MAEESVSIGIKDNDIVIIGSGELRAGSCFAIDDFLGRYLDKSEGRKKITIDLSGCTYMDSTFIGFIISLVRKSERGHAAGVTVLNPSPSAIGSLKKLSALPMLDLKEGTLPTDVKLFPLKKDQNSFEYKKNIELVFDAHVLLSELSEENREEFADLIRELSKGL